MNEQAEFLFKTARAKDTFPATWHGIGVEVKHAKHKYDR